MQHRDSPALPDHTQEQEDLLKLSVRYLDGRLNEDERRRLAEALRSSAEARAAFVHLCDDVILLRDLMAARDVRDDLLVRLEEHATPGPLTQQASSNSVVRRAGQWLAAACVIGAIGVGLWAAGTYRYSSDARLASEHNARWSDGAVAPGARLEAELGVLHRLEVGLAEVDLRSGARITLEGPTSFEITGRNSVLLHEGKLFAHVPERAHGFRVDIGDFDVVDLGTSFGVQRTSEDEGRVLVYEGSVRVDFVRSIDGVFERVLLGGQGLELNGDEITEISFDPRSLNARSMFAERVAQRLLLSDMIAGGDGTGDRRGRGIDPISGEFVAPSSIVHHQIRGDSRFVEVTDSPFIDGVFLPAQDRSSAVIDSAGGRFNHYRMNQRFDGGRTFGPIWSGRALPSQEPRPQGETRMRTDIDGIEYAAPGRSAVILHPNKGITFDIDAIESAQGPWQLRRLTGIVANTEAIEETRPGVRAEHRFSADFWVLIDGELVFTAFDLTRYNGAVAINVAVPEDAERITLIATAGLNSITTDWVMLGDASFELVKER